MRESRSPPSLSLNDERREPRLTDSEAGLFFVDGCLFCVVGCLLLCRVFVVMPVLDGVAGMGSWPFVSGCKSACVDKSK